MLDIGLRVLLIDVEVGVYLVDALCHFFIIFNEVY